MRILITGVTGFAGSHLADHLLAQSGVEVWGASNRPDCPPYLDRRVRLTQIDLCNPASVDELLDRLRPDQIYHLAGQAFVPQSWADPWDTMENNIRPQLNLIQSCLRLNLKQARILSVCSNEEYGRLNLDELPARETTPFRADSPYGVSKIAQDFLAQAYHLSHGLHIIRVRPFNHIGPRQNPRFVAADFASQIAAIERGLQPPVIRVGNLKAERDFTDVRDVVRGYAAVLDQGRPGEVYNIASGRPRPVQAVLDGLLALSTASIAVEVDPAKFRPSDTPRQQGDATKMMAATGWAPAIPFERSLKDLLTYERERLS
ncbi:MAG: GDP-mannose 4,6-dehydratase [Chloroflexi bacterium]|nr:GDP-mannose 4,6-dehydratase [Chloroflexota bacterium]